MNWMQFIVGMFVGSTIFFGSLLVQLFLKEKSKEATWFFFILAIMMALIVGSS